MSGLASFHYGVVPPDAEATVEVCYDRAESVVWLQLTNSENILNGGTSPNFVTVLIGAINQGNRWAMVDAGTAQRYRQVTVPLGYLEDAGAFQKAIIAHWRAFDGNRPAAWAKGTTFGTSLTSASFVMKALKTGFDAVGKQMSAYSGFRTKDFEVRDVINYLQTRARGVGADLGRSVEFDGYAPCPAWDPPFIQDRATNSDSRVIPFVPSRHGATHGGRWAYSEETGDIPFTRVIGYGFRGDSRAPGEIRGSGGFLPNYTRTGHIEKAEKEKMAQDQALNLGSFIADQFYGGYISVTKSVAVAKGFATGMGGTTDRKSGWIYACFVEGAFELPKQGTIEAGVNVQYAEQELSMPGLLDWEDIVGYRRVGVDGQLNGWVYIRPNLFLDDPGAARELWDLMSGRSQGSGL